MVATIGAMECIRNARRAGPDDTNIQISVADHAELLAMGRIKTETYRQAHLPGNPQTTAEYLEGLIVAVMGEPLSVTTFEPREEKLTATRAAEARDRAFADARGNEPHNAISAVDAIMFAIHIEDHFDRLQWLMDWRDGAWGEMRRSYPEFAAGSWRTA